LADGSASDWFIFLLSRSKNIQTPFALIVHPKLNSGKETVAHAEFGMRIMDCADTSALLKRRHVAALQDASRVPNAPNFRQVLDCGALHRFLYAAFAPLAQQNPSVASVNDPAKLESIRQMLYRWLHMKEWFQLAFRPSVVKRALKYALIVGFILIAINHSDAILSGQVTRVRLLKMLLTVMVPYVVSTLSSVGTLLETRGKP
jgi:hypothetical protein